MPEPALEIDDVRKRYGDTRALDGLSLVARAGEVLGIAGPNGAGKSTLIRILAGEETPDAGRLVLDGQPWAPKAGGSAAAVVHQEPQLFPNLTVTENLLVGRERSRVRRPRGGPAERAVLADLGLAGVAAYDVETLRLADQQNTEVARALDQRARVFLFDEPNSALTEDESAMLFRRMRTLASEGHVVLLVSHRLSELVANCSRVAIVRDGRCHGILEGDRLTEESIAHELVVGERVEERDEDARAQGDGARTLARVRGWTHGAGLFEQVDLTLAEGDVLALIGVEGSGARELLRSLALVDRASGDYQLGEPPGERVTPRRIAYVPATRRLSLYAHMDVQENLTVRLTDEISGRFGALRKARLRALAARARQQFGVKADSLRSSIGSLSGGNQQKVAIAQALAKRPRLLLVEEPTRGVDIRSRREIYRLLRGFARAGNAVVMFCTEVPEVFEAADRAIVVSEGRLSATIDVRGYGQVEGLARDVARLELHPTAAAETGDR